MSAGEGAMEKVRAVVVLAKPPPSAPPQPSWTDGLTAVGGFIDVIAWPLVAALAIVLFRHELRGFIDGLTGAIRSRRVKLGKDGIEIGEVLREAAVAVDAAPPAAAGPQARAPDPDGERVALDVPAPEDLARAGKVELIADQGNEAWVQNEAHRLAIEYERVRGSMLPGDTRTREMERVMAKMRALGRAVYKHRHHYMSSEMPGERLQAVACLQVQPAYDDLPWLIDRIRKEKPFVGYHAALALVAAARAPQARGYLPALQAAVAELDGPDAPHVGGGTDRAVELDRFRQIVARLQAIAS